LTLKHKPHQFLPPLTELCAKSGVAVSVIRAPQGCRASGATRFISPQKAILQLSFRFLTDDHFWFTFFHEAAHLVLHRHAGLVLEDIAPLSPKEEQQANDFATDLLIPKKYSVEFAELRADSRQVLRFARKVGVSPGIVVGQMQHRGQIRRDYLNGLKRHFEWH
jgi:Zn-dependent peptidase ImmA (M78 family)